MKEFVIITFILITLSSNSFGANILVLEEIPSGSHHTWMKKISYGLAARGHNITSLSAITEEDGPVHYLKVDKMKVYEFINVHSASSLRKTIALGTFLVDACKHFTDSIGWQQLLNYPDNFKFDLIIYDYLSGCQIAFAQKFNLAQILGTASGKENALALMHFGYPLLPSINTICTMTHFGNGLIDSINNYIAHIQQQFLTEYYFGPRIDAMVRKTMPNLITLRSIQRKSRLMLLNNNPVAEKSLYPSNVIQVSGLHIENVKPLPKDIEEIMNSAVDGVILFSIGSYLRAEMLDALVLQHIISSFEALPNYNIIWQFNGQITLPKNVYKYKWVPQNDILGHPKTKLFISHCGLLSVQESTYHGVPILGIPFAQEQFLNSELLIKSGVGEQIQVKDITSTLFSEKIHKILTSNSYYKNMKQLSETFRDQKDHPLERAIWWAEWLIRNPDEIYIHDSLENFNFMQRQSLDVLFVLQIGIFLTLFVSLILSKFCWGILCKSKNKSRNKNKKLN